jgi:hypothetical protein
VEILKEIFFLELKNFCNSLNIKWSGNKDKLIERIIKIKNTNNKDKSSHSQIIDEIEKFNYSKKDIIHQFYRNTFNSKYIR